MPGRKRQHSRHSRHRPKPDREQLKRYFIGTEGTGERALARWIEFLCNEAGHKIWFDIPGTGVGGGSTLDIIRRTFTNQDRSHRGPYIETFVFLDEDRRRFDGPAAEELAQREDLHLVWQTPNLEGVFLRLFPGQENRQPPADRTAREFARHWPNYGKNKIAATDLRERFSLNDLQRVAQFDNNLLRLLQRLRLDDASSGVGSGERCNVLQSCP